jgi:hypothetical protein
MSRSLARVLVALAVAVASDAAPGKIDQIRTYHGDILLLPGMPPRTIPVRAGQR